MSRNERLEAAAALVDVALVAKAWRRSGERLAHHSAMWRVVDDHIRQMVEESIWGLAQVEKSPFVRRVLERCASEVEKSCNLADWLSAIGWAVWTLTGEEPDALEDAQS